LNILFLAPHPFFQPRGTPLAERRLLEVLAAQGHHIDVLTYPEGEDPRIPNCRILRLPDLSLLRGVRPGFSARKLALDVLMLGRCLALARHGGYDLIHAVEESAFLALLARRLFGVPYVYDMDSGLARQMVDRFPWLRAVRRGLDACERTAVRGSLGVLAVCRTLADQARAWAPETLVARVEDPTLLGPPAEQPERLAGLFYPPDAPSSPPIVLYVGNLEPYQGIDLLLAGFARAHAEVPEARLAVLGGAPSDIARYRDQAARRGLGAAVRFAGPRPVERLNDYVRQATVLVSPRVQGTNTPMKISSYLDSGRPLLASRLPTHTQILDEDVALLVEPEPAAFGQGLVCLLRDAALREHLAENARRFAQRELTPAATERKLLAFYAEVAARLEKPLLTTGAANPARG
jgi:glycosyltransferase involved in cell wall biosynthesis